MKKPTQKERLIKALQRRYLTTYEACLLKLTTKLPSRISELKEQGYKIKQVWVTPKNIKAHFKYKIR